uniref:Uncharacterized protein n=1 Tax=Physcomitrium patens TaxID=3218 RepID=A0A7I4EM18_PHYPA
MAFDRSLTIAAVFAEFLNVIMEAKTGKISLKNSVQYECPLDYVIEDVRPHGGSEKYRSAVYSNIFVSLPNRN